jgi:hypothetical protein
MKRNHTNVPFIALAAVAVLALGVAPAGADVHPEIRGGYYMDQEEAFIGGGLNVSMSPYWYFNPNLEWVFVEGYDYFDVNLDIHRDLNTGSGPAVWLGAGAAIIFIDGNDAVLPANDKSTDLGLNLLGGVGAKYGAVRPFGQVKVTLSDNSESSLAFGLRF